MMYLRLRMILLTFILLKLSYFTNSLPTLSKDDDKEKDLIDYIPEYAKADGLVDGDDRVYSSDDDFEFDDELSGDFDGSEIMNDYVYKKPVQKLLEQTWKFNLKTKVDLYEGDIKLDEGQKLHLEIRQKLDKIMPETTTRSKRAARSKEPEFLWKHNTIYYKIDSGFSRSTKLEIKRGIRHWKKTMKNCLKFIRLDKDKSLEANISRDVFNNGPVEHILFTKTSTGCWSQVGRTDTNLEDRPWVHGQQLISIDVGCGEKGTVIHEIGHAIGFWHEQSRRDRDSYIRIIKNNILFGQFDQFKKMSVYQTDSLGYAYDFWSVMHYGPTFFSRNGNPTIRIRKPYRYLKPNIGQRNSLSYLDIAQVRAMYQCNVSPSKESKKTCIKKSTKGRDYRGSLDYTKSGIMCQPWFKQYPHAHKTDLSNKADGLGKHNYCRNPGGEKERPWCYTTQQGTEWEYCDIEKMCDS